jgi:hypothetical protein
MHLDLADREILRRILNVRQILDLEDVIRKLRSEIERLGSRRAFARKAGVNISVVSRHCGARYCHPKKFFVRSNFAWFIYRNGTFAADDADRFSQHFTDFVSAAIGFYR